MTKKIKEKKKEYKPSIWLFIALFAFPLLLTVLYVKHLDNDIWYLLSEGRYIVENGIYHIDPLSIHEGLQVTVQNWLSASIFWIIFDMFGEMGLYTLIIICNFFICLLLYKICMLLSEKNYILSLLIMFLCDITLTSHYIVSRPQIISFIVLLGVIYALELYVKTENWKYLIWLPVLSLIEVNMHASLWWMIFLFTLPYVIDSFKIPFLRTQGFKKKPLFIAIAVAFLVGFINPYGYKAITFIFTSYGDTLMHQYISELLPFRFTNNLSKHMFIVMMTIGIIYTLFREGKVRVRYICLFCGTMILGFMSVKGFSHFILVSMFPLAYFFSDMFPKDFSTLEPIAKKIVSYTMMGFSILCIGGTCYFYFTAPEKIKLKHDADGAMEALKRFDSKDAIVYSSFNNGGYVEYNGYKAYIDPRAEVFLKKNNKKEDIFKENYDVQHGTSSIEKFINKYKFTHLLVQNTDKLYNGLQGNENYFVYYENTNTGYRLYVRNDQVSDDEREAIIKSYNDAIEKAKEEAGGNTNKNEA